jgi:hypothetical protein
MVGKPPPSLKSAGEEVKPKASSRVAAFWFGPAVVEKSARPKPSGMSSMSKARSGVVCVKGAGDGVAVGAALPEGYALRL